MPEITVARQYALRTGRTSIEGATYSITSCIADRRTRLVVDPVDPHGSAVRVSVIISCLKWLHEHRRICCHAYVVMPEQIHLIVGLGAGQTLGRVMASFGSFTARGINRLDAAHGPLWQDGFYDHLIRNDEDLGTKVQYALANPVRKGYVLNPEDWPFAEAYPDWPVAALS